MKILSMAALVLFAIAVDAKDERSEITIHNDNIGNLVMSVPSEWRETQSTDDLSGASLMDVQSKKPKFQLRMEFSYFGLDGRRDDQDIDDYIGQRLDSYMQYQMEEFTENSVEGEFTSEVFGPGRHGRVARLTVRQRDRDDYLFITHGARIVDNAIVVFTLRSSDTDQAVLDQVVDVVSKVSMDNEIASFVGSYSCRTEHRVGFAGRNAVWIPDIADVVDQVFIVRTTSDGDQFADKTSWVFVENPARSAETPLRRCRASCAALCRPRTPPARSPRHARTTCR
jgi:hypothetical protein